MSEITLETTPVVFGFAYKRQIPDRTGLYRSNYNSLHCNSCCHIPLALRISFGRNSIPRIAREITLSENWNSCSWPLLIGLHLFSWQSLGRDRCYFMEKGFLGISPKIFFVFSNPLDDNFLYPDFALPFRPSEFDWYPAYPLRCQSSYYHMQSTGN